MHLRLGFCSTAQALLGELAAFLQSQRLFGVNKGFCAKEGFQTS